MYGTTVGAQMKTTGDLVVVFYISWGTDPGLKRYYPCPLAIGNQDNFLDLWIMPFDHTYSLRHHFQYGFQAFFELATVFGLLSSSLLSSSWVPCGPPESMPTGYYHS
jgi:hypothetical protein